MGHRNPVKAVFVTYPQCERQPEELLETFRTIVAQYAIARETHEDGGHHLHAFFTLHDPKTLKALNEMFKPFNPAMNLQAARSARAILKYISKESKPLTNMDLDAYACKKAKIDPALIASTPVRDAILNGDISFHSARAFLFAQALLQEPYEHDDVRGEWVFGPPGVGKSRYARSYINPFLKSQNKWWDGYNGEETVILDDLDNGEHLGHFLKIWADRYACTGEIKGGTVQLRHQRFIITSNYPIEHFWPIGTEMYLAISRRFTINHMV